jgi:hypothetical protein
MNARLFTAFNEFFDALFELAARQENTPATPQTPNANIRAQPDDAPFVAATGMLLPQPHNITHPSFHRHV